jgi:hypothetical protein
MLLVLWWDDVDVVEDEADDVEFGGDGQIDNELSVVDDDFDDFDDNVDDGDDRRPSSTKLDVVELLFEVVVDVGGGVLHLLLYVFKGRVSATGDDDLITILLISWSRVIFKLHEFLNISPVLTSIFKLLFWGLWLRINFDKSVKSLSKFNCCCRCCSNKSWNLFV